MFKVKKQQNVRDCGISVIQALITFFHNKKINENELKHYAVYGPTGINLSNLIKLGEKFGLKLTAYEVLIKDLLKNNVKELMVALIKNENQGHYVLIKQYLDKKMLIIYDPIKGRIKMNGAQFSKIFLGIICTVEKIPWNHQQKFNKIWHSLVLDKPWMLVLGISLISINWFLMFIISYFAKIIFDYVIPGQLKNTLLVICVSFSLLTIFRVILFLIKNFLEKKFLNYLELKLIEKFRNALTLCSAKTILQFSANEYLYRFTLIPTICQFLFNVSHHIFNNILVIIFSSVTLLIISYEIFLAVITLLMAKILIDIIFFLDYKTLHLKFLQSQIEYFKVLHDFTMSLEQIRHPQYGNFFEKFFNKKIVQFYKNNYNFWQHLTIQTLFSELFSLLTPILITYVGAKLIFQNSLTSGVMIFSISMTHHFVEASKQLLNFGLNWNINVNYCNLLSVWFHAQSENIDDLQDINLPMIDLVKNKIESITLTKLFFEYDKPFFKIEHFCFDKNYHIKGENGSGKSTLLKILSSYFFYQQNFLVNNYHLNKYSLKTYREKVFFASSESYLPQTSILEYITLNQKNALKTFLSNVEKFKLLPFLKTIKLDLDREIIDNGKNFSAGQKQILNCLRLLAFSFDVILLDEAFENVDWKNVLYLSKIISNFQKAIFIEVSHSHKYISKGYKLDISKIVKYIE